ncbi:MAG: hypothetical protein CSA39_04435 [Flavobacteriales bacterium]|nr:MAG: hypothetical protein CR985_03850 [Flavobacteriales bacterium]PIE49120.1 MAG: hypothetical protein CSA39_04435 [Flavobacteriales bacterium]
MVYKIRIIADTENDVIRDVALRADANLEDLHNVITNAFGFTGSEMASFYDSDANWNQGREIPLFDMSGTDGTRQMDKFLLQDVLNEENNRMLYIYDFLSMWTFYMELVEILPEAEFSELPILLLSVGVLPEEAPDKQFVSQSDEEQSDDLYDDFNDVENLDGLNFDNFDDLMN